LFDDTFKPPDAAARLRRVVLVALAAFVATQGYFTLVPLFGSVSPVVFYGVDAIALFGASFGAIASIRIAIREKLDTRAIFTLVAALALAAANAWVFARLTFPWL
jgi:hypothetical protein